MDMLFRRGVPMEQKPFAMGVRIEHRRQDIDRSQYGAFAGHPALGAADYKLSCRPAGGRGVYTFCMCPGGEVIAAASAPGRLVVNGMSAHARDAENSNSALLVGVGSADYASDHPLFGRQIAGFDDAGALLTGIESRSSSPVHLPRDADGQSPVRGIFPCGEGAGFAGGILSAAVDGVKCGEWALSVL